MKTYLKFVIAAACLTLAVAPVAAQKKSAPQPHKGKAETTLVGINLLDSGAKVIAKYGAPDDIQALVVGSTNASPGGGGMSGRGGPSGGTGAPSTRGGGGGAAKADFLGDPFGMGMSSDFSSVPDEDRLLGPTTPPGTGSAGGGSASPMGMGGGAGRPGATGPGVGPGSGAGAPYGPNGPGGNSGKGGSSQSVTYTRWVYNRSSSRYSFVLDKYSHVVQIEVVGLSDAKAKTKRGVHFGSNFAELIKKYNAPDSYDIASDNIIVKYLVRDHVAFRLSRLEANKPHRVTGIVVAAGK